MGHSSLSFSLHVWSHVGAETHSVERELAGHLPLVLAGHSEQGWTTAEDTAGLVTESHSNTHI